MKFLALIAVCLIIMLSFSGCLTTQVVERERVDQDFSGNRGVLIGNVPPAPQRDTVPTRTYIAVDVEIPTVEDITRPLKRASSKTHTPDKELWGNKGSIFSGKNTGEVTSYEYEAERIEKAEIIEGVPGSASTGSTAGYTEYTVKKGDTLSTIAARDEIYGDGGKWTVIYEANKDILRSPSHIYPGQTIKIPVIAEEERPYGGKIK